LKRSLIFWRSGTGAAMVLGFVLLSVALTFPARSAVSEAQIKAAYLYKLASFVRWPASTLADPATPLRICVAGRPDVYAVVEVLTRGQVASGRRLAAEMIEPTRPGAVAHCQILFIGQGEAATRTLLAQVAQLPVLTVTDRGRGTRGGIIEFVLVEGNVRFAIHRQAAEARQLTLSSKLLAVAASVEP
jgi:hypothetical protein